MLFVIFKWSNFKESISKWDLQASKKISLKVKTYQ